MLCITPELVLLNSKIDNIKIQDYESRGVMKGWTYDEVILVVLAFKLGYAFQNSLSRPKIEPASLT